MRYIVTVVAALIVSTTCHAQGRSIFIHNGGTHSCGKYLAAVQGHAPGAGMMRGQFSDDHFLYMAWLGGFFSAMNVWMMDERNEIRPRRRGHRMIASPCSLAVSGRDSRVLLA